MTTDLVHAISANLAILQNQPLSGGIVAKNLHISDNGSGELSLYGDFTITLKVLDLTTNGAPSLNNLMTFTQQVMTAKLRGGGYKGGIRTFKYNSAKNIFDKSKNWTYSIRYNFNFIVNVIQISMLNQLKGNDFVLAVVDSIGHQFTDQYGRRQSSGGLTQGEGGPATVSYNSWKKNKYIGVHEFFHTLSLDDIEDPDKKNRLMYHLGDNSGQIISDTERGDIFDFIRKYLGDITKVSQSNINLNTVNQLKTFLNNPINGFKFNKTRFR
ncbi:hypothetical protein EV200_105152 [Pedobacter psychrotolerans]|uniref:Uncharacterized protein n=1 Tax=Pedobacter psychrotolerans TaxID=1843235 RepID=A0A4R2HA74_9SPHI|nr:hypothetical protein [Pedobacter psychrotolerans]TCO23683.1 hypothetical protein EV200_105152 [Pedobacter psychrotolerans]GGE61803.1 hypothetical protein GCM10011413_30210 [Pedobacter psychrotolerans]